MFPAKRLELTNGGQSIPPSLSSIRMLFPALHPPIWSAHKLSSFVLIRQLPRRPQRHTLMTPSCEEAQMSACYAITPLAPQFIIPRPPPRQYRRMDPQLLTRHGCVLPRMTPQLPPQDCAPRSHCVLLLVQLLPSSVPHNVQIVCTVPMATARMVIQNLLAWMYQSQKDRRHRVRMAIEWE